ncbi:MAG TPA: biotin carboxylase N-terminal domain-containing protein [Pseudonocardia sp.]
MFRTVLIANRGEIARRVGRTCRELGITVAAVYADADADALHVRDADLAVRLPGNSPAETYLDIDRILEAAGQVSADAVHPGYGFLSENAELATRCTQAGLTFIGPSAEAIRLMGSKTAAKRTMARAGVPLLPSAELTNAGLTDADALCLDIGLPVLIKASAGGGGKAMRIVSDAAELDEAVESCRREARNAFGDDTVFLEKYLTGARHIEIQVFGDRHGNVVALGERECSIQRRYQKVIEEAPSAFVDAELRKAMCAAAVAAAQAIGYQGAGTVEFLVDADRRFYFLEMNTRLQVEHPVTELVTGLDLVRLQLLVAAGRPLPNDLPTERPNGHAIEARVYAEDVAAGFLPASGRLYRFEIPARPGLRVDSGVETGSEISIHYDPMLAKVIAHGPTRAEAAALLAAALRRSCIDGVATNVDLLVGTLTDPGFLAGATTTGFLAGDAPDRLSAAGRRDLDKARPAYLAAAALMVLDAGRRASPVLSSVPTGFRSTPSAGQRLDFDVAEAGCAVEVFPGRGRPRVTVDGVEVELSVHRVGPELADLTVHGVRRMLRGDRAGDRLYLHGPEGVLAVAVRPRFPDPDTGVESGSLTAPMPGSVVRVPAQVGAAVAAGDPLVVLEAMKMEHTIRATAPGQISAVKVAVGDQVDSGAVLVVLQEQPDPAEEQ